MRFLADAGISPETADFLRRRDHEAVHVRELGMQRAPDRLLVDRARAEDRVLLTFGLDFGEILALGVMVSPSVVIFRLSDERADPVNRRLEEVISAQAGALVSGALILVEDARYRIRRLPIRCDERPRLNRSQKATGCRTTVASVIVLIHKTPGNTRTLDMSL